MSRINSNVLSLIAQRSLKLQNQALGLSLERLSTGLQINRGKDGPAALIASESLRSEKAAIGAAVRNGERAEQVVNVAEGGLQEINNLLVELETLVTESANKAGISTQEKEANQLQIDSILQSIDRIANATSFNGVKLLNGNYDYTTSGVSTSLLSDVNINSAKLSDASGSYITVSVDVITSAQTGVVFMSTNATLLNGGNGSITLEVTGNRGVQQFTFASGTSQANILTAINTFKDAIGVSAIQNATDTDRVQFNSLEFGSAQFARVKVVEGTSSNLLATTAVAAVSTNDLKDTGRDATVLINGTQATTDGLKARVASDGLDVTVAIVGTSTLNDDGQNETFYITGGGANFNLSPNVDLAGKVSIGFETATTGNLGNAVDGYLSALKAGGTANVANGDLTKAQRIVESAINQISSFRGRLGAFQRNTVQTTINNLGVTLENITAAESQIRDTDFAEQTANLTRSQILVQAASQVLSLANAQPQNVLSLLG
jgi:flagellin